LQWALSKLKEMHLRRYNLRRSALEFFLCDFTNYFINLTSKVSSLIVFTELQLNAFCFDSDTLQGLLANPAAAASKLDPLQLEIACRAAEAIRTHSAMGGLGNQQL
jgi:PH domain associated with Beige/BEACH